MARPTRLQPGDVWLGRRTKVSNHLVRPNSWGLFSAAGMESGAFYQLTVPYPDPFPTGAHGVGLLCGPTPGNITVAEQHGQWAALMARLGCSIEDVGCAVNVPALRLLELGQLPGTCPWMPAIDGVDLTAPTAELAASGRFAPGVPIILGSNMEEGGIVGPNCAPASCTKADFLRCVHGFASRTVFSAK